MPWKLTQVDQTMDALNMASMGIRKPSNLLWFHMALWLSMVGLLGVGMELEWSWRLGMEWEWIWRVGLDLVQVFLVGPSKA